MGAPRAARGSRSREESNSERARDGRVTTSFSPGACRCESGRPTGLKKLLRIEQSEKLNQLRHHSCPSGLMARAEPGAVIPMKVFVEQDIVAPVRVGLKLLSSTINRTSATLVAREDAGQPVGDLLGNFEEVH